MTSRSASAPRALPLLVCLFPLLLSAGCDGGSGLSKPLGEAFQKAEAEKTAVLLVLDEPSCDLCSRVRKVTFEKDGGARAPGFVLLQQDAVERPDLAALYGAAAEALGGAKGPLNITWLLPDGRPFAGIAHAPSPGGSQKEETDLSALLGVNRDLVTNERSRAEQTAGAVLAQLQDRFAPKAGSSAPGAEAGQAFKAAVNGGFDSTHGGLKRPVKSPRDFPVAALLRIQQTTADKGLLEKIEQTLARMASGSVYDQVDGGFFDEAQSPSWNAPRFEKHLALNALLASTYIEASQATGNMDYRAVGNHILSFLRTSLRRKDGLFAHGLAGTPASYTWTEGSLADAFQKDLALGKRLMDLRPDPLAGGFIVPALARGSSAFRGMFKIEVESVREVLQKVRAKWPAPARDDRAVTAEQGLALSAYSHLKLAMPGGQMDMEPRELGELILKKLRTGEKLVRGLDVSGASIGPAVLEDYAYVIAGLLDLFEADSDAKWLKAAIELQAAADGAFGDEKGGGYFMTDASLTTPLLRLKSVRDGALPSGNAVMALNGLRLAEWTGKAELRTKAEATLRLLDPVLRDHPLEAGDGFLAADFHVKRPKEIIIVTPAKKRSDAELLLGEFRQLYVPHHVLCVLEAGAGQDAVGALSPLVERKYPISDKATAYVCEGGVCRFPTSDPVKFRKLLTDKPVSMLDGEGE